MRVLFVSDSLGCPIEQRGIHNFSMSLIDALHDVGAEVTLVVERPPGRWFAGAIRSSVVDLGEAKKSVALAEVLRYFGNRKYGTSWIHRRAEQKFFPRLLLKLVGWCYVGFVRLWAGPKIEIENDLNSVDFIPPSAYHLAQPDRFVVAPAVYTEMMMRAAWGLPPDTIDAKGFDLCIVDTPSYFKIVNIDHGKILSVIHDLIPLRDPMMTPYWRNIFLKKLEGVVAHNPNFAFVSEYSKGIFEQVLPKYKIRKSFIYYPTLRRTLVKQASEQLDSDTRRYAPLELTNAMEASRSLQKRLNNEGAFKDGVEKQIALSMLYEREARLEEVFAKTGWDPSLPYFVTVVSDEARKNINIFIKAFATLRGRANMVILGNVDGKRYVGVDSNLMGNVRFTGFISEAEKHRIIALSDGLIFPSFTEGFGIPLIEGALYSKPVLCSDIEVFHEVAGDEAIYFDPYKDSSLVAAVKTVLADKESAQALAIRLKQRVLQLFTLDAARARLATFLVEAGLLTQDQVAAASQKRTAKEAEEREKAALPAG